MKKTEFNESCEAVGLATQGAIAEFFCLSLRTAHGWCNGSPIPELVAKVLRYMVRNKITAELFGGR